MPVHYRDFLHDPKHSCFILMGTGNNKSSSRCGSHWLVPGGHTRVCTFTWVPPCRLGPIYLLGASGQQVEKSSFISAGTKTSIQLTQQLRQVLFLLFCLLLLFKLGFQQFNDSPSQHQNTADSQESSSMLQVWEVLCQTDFQKTLKLPYHFNTPEEENLLCFAFL